MTSSAPIDFCNTRFTDRRLIHTLWCNREHSNCCSTTKPQRHVSQPIYGTDQRHREESENSIDVTNTGPSLSIRFRVRISRMHYGLLWKWGSRRLVLQLSNGCDCTDSIDVLWAVLVCTIWLTYEYILYFVRECTALVLKRFGFAFLY